MVICSRQLSCIALRCDVVVVFVANEVFVCHNHFNVIDTASIVDGGVYVTIPCPSVRPSVRPSVCLSHLAPQPLLWARWE